MPKQTKRVSFSRPVAIEELTYEIEVPLSITSQEEIEKFILENQDKLETLGNSDYYSLTEDSNGWTEFVVSIHPYINVTDDTLQESKSNSL